MATMQDVIDRGRIPLNDADKDRYSDPDLLAFANAGLERAYAIRPDLRFGSYAVATADLVAGATFPLPRKYLQTLADYVTFRAETKDDEHVVSQRAALFEQSFEKELMS